MQNIAVQECIQASIKRGVIAALIWKSAAKQTMRQEITHRLYSVINTNNAFNANNPTEPPVPISN